MGQNQGKSVYSIPAAESGIANMELNSVFLSCDQVITREQTQMLFAVSILEI